MIEINKIHAGNCLDHMAEMPDGFVDLTVTSPPYDNLRTYNGYTFDFEPIARELYRVTKKGGVVVWVVGDATVNGSETGTSFRQALYFKEIGFNLHDTMIYHRQNAMPLNHNRYDAAFEYTFILSKGKPVNFHPLREATQYAGAVKKRFLENKSALDNGSASRQRDEMTVVKTDRYRQNIWAYSVGTEAEIETGTHPAIFPEALARDHILSWSNENDLVYDPFMGSGTTAKAAHQLNRRWIGSEISQEYVTLAEKRLEPYLNQESLF